MNRYKDLAGKPYMPSNGTEGMMFCDEFCDQCIHQHPDPGKSPQCDDILLQSLIGKQPKEWVYDSEGRPTCTAFKKWDWGSEGDWIEPEPPEPEDPNQLCFPWDILDILGPDLIVTNRAIMEEMQLV